MYVIHPKEWFPIKDLLLAVPNLGLVIDLTGSPKPDRYYNESELIDRNIGHQKIVLQGFGQMPREKDIQTFIRAVDEFNSVNPDKLIGVHCTHGLNRTGFMICKYLILRKGINPAEALALFQNARGHEIERDVYVKAILESSWPVSRGHKMHGIAPRQHPINPESVGRKPENPTKPRIIRNVAIKSMVFEASNSSKTCPSDPPEARTPFSYSDAVKIRSVVIQTSSSAPKPPVPSRKKLVAVRKAKATDTIAPVIPAEKPVRFTKDFFAKRPKK